MIKKWKEFIKEEFIDNSESIIDIKMQEINDLVGSISDENSQNLIYEWENKKEHELIVNFTKDDLSIRYEFDIDNLYIVKFAGGSIDFEQPVQSIDEGLDIIEKDIHLIKDWEADYDKRSGKRIKTKKSAATKAYQRMFGNK